MVIVMEEDNNLELLIDSCIKTIATAKGNGHSEFVLYRNKKTNRYELHYYNLSVGAEKEFHGYKNVDEEVYHRLNQLIQENKLEEHKDIHGFGLCGGDYICKFKKDNEYIRITTANYNGENFGSLTTIFNAMKTYYNS